MIDAYMHNEAGEIVPCKNYGPVMLLQPMRRQPLRYEPKMYTRRERRQLARRGSGPHRRGAVRVKPERPIDRVARMPQPVRYDGHRIADGGRGPEYVLYLPDGRGPTQLDLHALERAIRAVTK